MLAEDIAKIDLDLWGHETVDNGDDLEPEVDLFPASLLLPFLSVFCLFADPFLFS